MAVTKSTIRPAMRAIMTPVERFLQLESASGIILIAAALVAFVWANSPWGGAYEAMRHAHVDVALGGYALDKPLEFWVNDLLMAVFFFLVGLEIKRELLVGELAGWKRASLPAVAALGGMIVPALIYVWFNTGTPLIHGWGVPMATDIAFAVGVLTLLGDRVPLQLKIFLLALAIVDDLGAVIVIAVFYTADLNIAMLAAALAFWVLAWLYGRAGGKSAIVFTLIGVVVWGFTLESGIHATIAGVLMALAIPLRHAPAPEELDQQLKTAFDKGSFEQVEMKLQELEILVERARSPLHSMEHALQPWVAFVIMPVFALYNAGVHLGGAGGDAPLLSSATWGVFFGLLFGKPLGIFAFVWVAVTLGITALPRGTNWTALFGIGLLAGIGFTMALFIANLAFGTGVALDQAKLGVLAASVVAAVAGLLFLRAALPTRAGAPIAGKPA